MLHWIMHCIQLSTVCHSVVQHWTLTCALLDHHLGSVLLNYKSCERDGKHTHMLKKDIHVMNAAMSSDSHAV